jgi:diacylglycerol kinase (ATP)
MDIRKFSFKRRAKSFHFALEGFYHFFSTQHNAIIHGIATILVIILSCAAKLSSTELLFVLTVTGLVWTAELFNTAIEKLCDVVSPQKDPAIKFIKDVSAAAVLVTAILSVIIGCIIFIPKFL